MATKIKTPPRTKDVAVAVCLDESGSMGNRVVETTNGFNTYLTSLLGQEGKTVVTLTQFSDRGLGAPMFRTSHDSVAVAKFPPITDQTYRPHGNTPLYDAIGHTITKMDAKLAGKAKQPTVIIVIQTDGLENASRDFTQAQIREMIQDREAAGWLFIYLGADQDDLTAERASQAMGMSVGSSMSYDTHSSDAAFASMGSSTEYARTSRAAGMHVNSASLTNTAKASYENLTGTATPGEAVTVDGFTWDPTKKTWIVPTSPAA